MLDITQLLSFEIGTDCNLSDRHSGICPINNIDRGNRVLTDELIVNAVKDAHDDGFTGMVAFHFYNEPMLHTYRMFTLMDKILKDIPNCRFALWTNGTILIKDHHLKLFDRTYISNYFNFPMELYESIFTNVRIVGFGEDGLDSRLQQNLCSIKNYGGCRLPAHDMQINNGGSMHLCCHDWENEIYIGNLFDSNIKTLAQKKFDIFNTIQNGITDESPKKCLTCKYRLNFVCEFDIEIAQKATLILDDYIKKN